MIQPANVPEKDHSILAATFSALAMVMFLFFIDEGYYDFRWMRDVGNWIVFCFYLSVILPVMWLLARYVFRKFAGWEKVIAVSLTGIAIITACIYLLS